MEIKLGTADFSSPISGSGPRTMSVPVLFPTALEKAAVGITGYNISFGGNSDHHVGRIDVEVSCTINDNVVMVEAVIGLRDWSGDWDDLYGGTIDFAVLAALAPAQTRADLIISDIETNQAVQFFRSNTYLSTATALPDNAIPLFSGKNTGLRIYPDWAPSLGLPLSGITGSVVVTKGGSTTMLTPLRSATATPLPADAINMAVIDHTLNFMIPGALCTGQVDISAQLWDIADSTSKTGLFTRTLIFNALPPLNIFLVGVNYTANGLNLAAPTQADFTGSGFPYLQQVYPMGSISQTGYSTITFSEDVNFTIGAAGGCGTGMNDLLSQMDDMRGASSDIYLAVLPNLSAIQTTGSNIGGCGQPGVGAVFLDQTTDVPHEVGHALGRRHAPCDPGQCTPPPSGVDANYPSYGAFPAGSIGCFGFDPIGYQVFNPSSTFDTMAYRFPQWISAYTYLALSGAGHPSEGGTGGGLGGAHATTDVEIDTLFLDVRVNRDRSVLRRVSFHFAAPPRPQKPCSCYTVEFLDVERRVLLCAPLSCDCDDTGHHCWPKRLRSAVPYPKHARWMLIYEEERKLHEEWIPRPPCVEIESQKRDDDGGLVVAWKAKHDGEVTNCCEFWYLVQWYDDEQEVWRGVAPRLRANHLRISPTLLHGRGPRQFRVLASCGVATGVADFETDALGEQRPTLTLIGVGRDNELRTEIRVVPQDVSGRHLPMTSVTWVVRGKEISGGSALDLRALREGTSDVHVFVHTPDGTLQTMYKIHRRGAMFTLADVKEQRSKQDPVEGHIHPHP